MHCCIYCKLNIKPKEQALLKDLMTGCQDKQMAKKHDIPLYVVKYRLRTLYDKIGAANRTQAALMGREIGL